MFTQQLKVWHDDFYLLITITPDQEIWLYQADTDNIIETKLLIHKLTLDIFFLIVVVASIE